MISTITNIVTIPSEYQPCAYTSFYRLSNMCFKWAWVKTHCCDRDRELGKCLGT